MHPEYIKFWVVRRVQKALMYNNSQTNVVSDLWSFSECISSFQMQSVFYVAYILMYMFEKIKKFTRVWILTKWIMKVIIFVFIYSPNFSKSKINFNKNLSTRILLSVTPTIHIDKSRSLLSQFIIYILLTWHKN